MLAIVGVGGLLGALSAGTIRRATTARTIVVAQEWVLVALVLALLLVHNALLIGLLIAAAEFVTPAVNSIVAGARVAAAPDHLQGRIQAAATMATMSLAWLGPLAVGVFFEHWGSTTTTLITVGWTLIPASIATFTPALRGDPPRALPAVRARGCGFVASPAVRTELPLPRDDSVPRVTACQVGGYGVALCVRGLSSGGWPGWCSSQFWPWASRPPRRVSGPRLAGHVSTTRSAGEEGS
jgi:hypothetical protein